MAWLVSGRQVFFEEAPEETRSDAEVRPRERFEGTAQVDETAVCRFLEDSEQAGDSKAAISCDGPGRLLVEKNQVCVKLQGERNGGVLTGMQSLQFCVGHLKLDGLHPKPRRRNADPGSNSFGGGAVCELSANLFGDHD